MKKHRKNFVVALLLTALLLSGCGQMSASPLNPEKPTTVTVWTYYNGAQLESFNALVDEFNTTVGKEQGIFVESFSQGSVNDLENNVLAAASGTAGASEIPNIFAAYADTAYTLDQQGKVADLKPYFTDEELAAYGESYVEEGRFAGDGSIKIFPVAKSTEIFLLNKTAWDTFSAATGATTEDFSTIEGLTDTARQYYEWTDGLTPEPNDGKAFFGRDAMANYFLIGSMQLGQELFAAEGGKMTLNLNKDVARKLWDNYYVPFVKGYFAASGRFRSDDVKTGNIISFVGSSSGATFFPKQVIVSDTVAYPIEMQVFPAPKFADGADYAVQQGAGMAVTSGTEAEVYASVQFLKWFTAEERNITFSVDSGYLPVKKDANQLDAIRLQKPNLDAIMEQILTVAVDTVNANTLYTPKAFSKGTDARAVLENTLSDKAMADRAAVLEQLAAGLSPEEAEAAFLSDANFEAWYAGLSAQLEAFAG